MNTLSEVVLRLVDDLPQEYVAHLAGVLQSETGLHFKRLKQRLQQAIPNPVIHKRVQQFIAGWKDLPEPPQPVEMARLLQTSADVLAYQRCQQSIELTWTGPTEVESQLRRTDQALLELIHAAGKQILIVSFAVYKAKAILSALEQAADRGVEITIVLESAEASEGKLAYNTLQALGASLREKSRVFIWPAAKRPHTPEGKIGSLHAKLAVADEKILYISSANLTDYAMTLNMEMGVLIHGGPQPAQAAKHFEMLITAGVLAQVEGGAP